MIEELLAAEAKAKQLLAETVRRGCVAAGRSEREISNDVYAIAKEMFGIDTYWHKRIIRAGPNTLLPYAENPPDHTLGEDDIMYFDMGPVFEEWEADLGVTLVIGDDPRKHKLATDIARAWEQAAGRVRDKADITAAQLYTYCGELAAKMGWELGHVHCGHVVGKFPHERDEGDENHHYIRADNDLPLRRNGVFGTPLHWILEIHFVDRAAGYGGFQEMLLL